MPDISDVIQQQPLRVISNRGQVPGQFGTGGGGASNYTRGESRYRFRAPGVAVYDLRPVYSNWYVNSGTGETQGFANFQIESAIELSGAAKSLPVNFGVTKSPTVSRGATAIGDAVATELESNADYFVRTGLIVASTALWAYNEASFTTDDRAVASTAGSGQIDGTGALSTPGGGIISTLAYGATCVLGRPVSPIVSIAVHGDSIAAGSGDNNSGDGNGCWGWIARGLFNVDGVAVPHVKLAMGGDKAQVNDAVNARWRTEMVDYTSHSIVQLGTNDVAGGRTFAQVRDDLITRYRALARRGHKIIGSCLPPKTTSSNSFTNAAGQTTAAGFEPGGVRDQVNAWIRAAGGGYLAGFIDINTVVEDPVAPGKWTSNGASNYATTDGTHMTEALHVLCAPLAAAAARSMRVNGAGRAI